MKPRGETSYKCSPEASLHTKKGNLLEWFKSPVSTPKIFSRVHFIMRLQYRNVSHLEDLQHKKSCPVPNIRHNVVGSTCMCQCRYSPTFEPREITFGQTLVGHQIFCGAPQKGRWALKGVTELKQLHHPCQ